MHSKELNKEAFVKANARQVTGWDEARRAPPKDSLARVSRRPKADLGHLHPDFMQVPHNNHVMDVLEHELNVVGVGGRGEVPVALAHALLLRHAKARGQLPRFARHLLLGDLLRGEAVTGVCARAFVCVIFL